MDGASTHSAFDELDFGTERHSSNIPVDVDLPPFEVLHRRCWVGKVVDMKNVSGVTIASGSVRNHHTVDLTTSAGSLSETHVPIQVSKTHVLAEALTVGDTVYDLGQWVRSSTVALAFFIIGSERIILLSTL